MKERTASRGNHGREGDGPGSPAEIALTFDVEEWFHAHNLRIPGRLWPALPSRLEHSVEEILNLLHGRDVHATFFILGWVARRLPGLVRRIQAGGHEVASHGWDHQPITAQTPAQFRADVAASKAILEDLAQEPVHGYRAPSYSIGPDTAWALDELEQLGFAYDSSIYPVRAPHGRYGHPGSPLRPHRIRPGLWEFPLPTWQVFGRRVPAATGAYLRLLPLAATRLAIAQNFRRKIPVVVNIHPWELDPGQPRWSAPLRSRLLHYGNLGTTRRKLVRLLETCDFARLRDLWRRYDGSAGVIERRNLQRSKIAEQRSYPRPSAVSERQDAKSTV